MTRHLLPEVGHMRITTEAGRDYTFRPVLSRVAALGMPHRIVEIYGELHQPDTAITAAAYVLETMCDVDCGDLIGRHDGIAWRFAQVPPVDMVIFAQQLMIDGIAGRARPNKSEHEGSYEPRFDVDKQVTAAMAHLGISRDEAMDMTMTEIHSLCAAKYPDAKAKARDVPTRDEYRAQMAAIMERRNKATGNAK